MSEPFNLSYKEQAFLIHIIGRIGADLQAKEGWSDLRVSQTLDFALIPGSFFRAYKAWPDAYRDDIARIINGEKPNQPLSILERAYENAFRVAEQRLAQLQASEAARVPPPSSPTPAPRAPAPDRQRVFLLGALVGVGVILIAEALAYFSLPFFLR
jgi:hypothetical protein